MVISKKQQSSQQQLTATLDDIDRKLVEKYEYLDVVLKNNMNYDAGLSINKSKKGNASTTTSLPKRHRDIHRESSACAQHQAHGGFSE